MVDSEADRQPFMIIGEAMSQHRIERVFPADTVINDGDMRLFRALPVEKRSSLGPFVFLDHYRHHSRRGIGDKPHPHAGIEVISYLLDGGVEHRDSLGFRDRLGPGDAQWIRAGRGILHAEQPTGGRHGLQLWTSLPPAMKFAEPAYSSFRASDIPEVRLPGAVVRIIAGTVNKVTGPMQNATSTLFAHIHLDAAAQVELEAHAEELGLYVLDGAIEAPDGDTLKPGVLAVFWSGTSIKLTATDSGLTDLVLIGGDRVQGDLVFAGPFVMDTLEHADQARKDYLSGKMGRLEGVPF